MRSESTGTPEAFSSSRCNRGDNRSGFTLLEALVALTLLLTFVSVLVPYLFHARRIMGHAENRMAAQILLRTLVNTPFDRSHLANLVRSGELEGLHWQVATSPIAIAIAPAEAAHSWTPYRVDASVSWGDGLSVAAETVRLARSK